MINGEQALFYMANPENNRKVSSSLLLRLVLSYWANPGHNRMVSYRTGE